MSARLRAVAEENERIVRAGRYTAADGTDVVIGPAVEAAATGTRLYGPAPVRPAPATSAGTAPPTVFEVTGEDSLAAAHRLTAEAEAVAEAETGLWTAPSPGAPPALMARPETAEAPPATAAATVPAEAEPGPRPGPGPAVLVFASARNPGGGYVNGAKAQEEALCRASALYHCLLRAPEYYAEHREVRDPFYSDRVIRSPGVPVFRDPRGGLLARPFRVGFLTSPAPNAGVIARQLPDRVGEIPAALARRAERVLEVAAAQGHRELVLGAWGCGVFRNDPAEVAAAFAAHLAGTGRFATRFDRVVLAIRDREDSPARTAFARVFGG